MRAPCAAGIVRPSPCSHTISPIHSAFPSFGASRRGCSPLSYLPLLMDAQTQRRLFDNYLNMILERRAEGVIVIASWIFEETNLLADIEKNQVPIVIVGRDLTSRRVSSLLVDNEAGGRSGLAAFDRSRPSQDRRHTRSRGTLRQRTALGRCTAGGQRCRHTHRSSFGLSASKSE